ncbi:YihY/virulence factor BrkB family protein [Marinobacter daqiaonensis]|nr:YihY/virulence factor BrkB family protein [Marinobacter daqiaonensis]
MLDASSPRQRTVLLIRRSFRFGHRVLGRFLRNHGILLAGGVGYNVLLSAIPLLAVLGVLLTHIVPEAQLVEVMRIQARHFASGHADLLLEIVQTFLDSRDVIGLIGIPVLLFFSSFAFRMLEDSIAIIFHQPDTPTRSFWVSAALPYAFILVLGIGLLTLTLIFVLADLFYERPGIILYPLSFVSVFVLFSAIYKVLPIVRIAPRRAVIGGFIAAVLWEGTRLILMYYLQNVSFVNVIYGSLATIIVLLISLEVGAIILLLGAQVIAELEHSAVAGRPWYQGAGDEGRKVPAPGGKQ